MTTTLLWYDLETSGIDPRGDRILQLAALRTDLDLRPVAEPVNLFCQPDPDLLPSVEATLVTRIDPEQLVKKGAWPPDFVRSLLEEMGTPGTCAVGYNSLRFDEEFIRHTLWRHLHEPYGREWRGGNRRWDLLNLTRLCRALRPETLSWPQGEDGLTSFRLEELARANEIAHESAHDALSDVLATLGLARRILKANPRLFRYAFSLRDKAEARRRIRVDDPAPILHVDPAWGRHREGLTAALALGTLPDQAVALIDLTRDPRELLDCPDDALPELLFPPWDGPRRPPVRAVRLNRSPPVAPLGVLTDSQRRRLDRSRIEAHAATLLRHRDTLFPRIQAAFEARDFPDPRAPDPERQLYEGFIAASDRQRADQVHEEGPDAVREESFDDPRLRELFFRYRARYFPHLLRPDEKDRWARFLHDRLEHGEGGNGISLRGFADQLAEARGRDDLSPEDRRLLDALERYGASRAALLRAARSSA